MGFYDKTEDIFKPAGKGELARRAKKAPKRQIYYFKVELGGVGNDPEEAWLDAIENFQMEPGSAPDEFTTAPWEDDR